MICCCAGRQIVWAGDLHVDVPQRRSSAEHSLHRAGVRHDDDVVLIGALGAQPFRVRTPVIWNGTFLTRKT